MTKNFTIIFNKMILDITRRHLAARMVNELEDLFKKYPDGFYKFFAPCNHKDYKKGDSWAEEIMCSRVAFNRNFEKLGIRYSSRKKFFKEKDPFKGKMYVSYYDRDIYKTFYIRNHKVADDFFSSSLEEARAKYEEWNKGKTN